MAVSPMMAFMGCGYHGSSWTERCLAWLATWAALRVSLQKLLLSFFLPDFRDVGAGQKDDLPLTVVVTVAQLFIPEDTILDGSGVEDVFSLFCSSSFITLSRHKTVVSSHSSTGR